MGPAIAYGAMAGLQIAGGLYQAQMIRMQSDMQSRINEMNAKYAEIDAYETEKFGDTEAAAYQVNIDQTVGEQTAGYAAQDVDVNFGTAADVIKETKTTGFLNQLEIRKQARAKAMGLRREAGNIRLNGGMQSDVANLQARSAQTAGFMQAGVTGLSFYTRK